MGMKVFLKITHTTRSNLEFVQKKIANLINSLILLE